MTQADILAIRVAVTNVTQAQNSLNAVKKTLNQVTAASQKSAQKQMTTLQQLKKAWSDFGRSGPQSFGSSIGRMISMFGTAAAAAGTLYAAVKSFESLDMTRKGLSNLLGGPELADKVLTQVRELADYVGVRATQLFPQARKLAASRGVATEDLVPTLRAFMALSRMGGADSVQMMRAFEQFTQIASQGKLQGDELRSMQENQVHLRALLHDAGLANRIGSLNNPIKFTEIRDALLKFGGTPQAEAYLKIGADNATASLNKLMTALELDLLPALGQVLTPAIAELGWLLKEYVESISKEQLQELGRNIAAAVMSIGQLGIKAIPTLLDLILFGAPIIKDLLVSLKKLNDFTNSALLKTYIWITVIGKLIGGAVSAFAMVTRGSIGRMLVTFVRWLVVKVIGGAISNFLLGFAAYGFWTTLTTAFSELGTVIGLATSGIVGITTAVVLLGAAIGGLIGWLLNKTPWAKASQKAIADAIHTIFGGKAADEAAGKSISRDEVNAAMKDLRLRNGLSPRERIRLNEAAQSARRSDPQRLINEATANGLRYAG